MSAFTRISLLSLAFPQYEGKLRQGNILSSVHSENSTETDTARKIFEMAGAHDIASASEKAA